jgi:XTP/dITP diphosphohydrolase
MELLLATRNRHKAREFRELLGHDFNVFDLSAFPGIALPEETGRTLEKNAILKAVAVSRDQTVQDRHLLVLADDSGLEVDALRGAPGVFSARYAGENASDRENIDKLLREIAEVWRNLKSCAAEVENLYHFRAARFRCVLALARDGKILNTFEGMVGGDIADGPRGAHGFGYDPVFVPAGFDQTFGELPSELKNQVSHRARAVRELRIALLSALNQGFGGGGGGDGGGPGCPPPGAAAVRI